MSAGSSAIALLRRYRVCVVFTLSVVGALDAKGVGALNAERGEGALNARGEGRGGGGALNARGEGRGGGGAFNAGGEGVTRDLLPKKPTATKRIPPTQKI
jgi:hypothetical protein